MKLRGRTGLKALPAAAVALLLLTGCGEITPGTASVVNGTRITNSEVTDLADAQCAGVALAVKAGQGQTVSRTEMTRSALGLLMDTQLNLDYAESLDLTPNPQAEALIYSRVEPLIEALPAKDQPATEAVFHRWAKARDLITQVGALASGQQVTEQNEDTILNEGYQKREAWLKKIKIETDPRYAPSKEGFPGGGDGSVSRAVSDFAKGGAATQQDAKWVAALPGNQRCG